MPLKGLTAAERRAALDAFLPPTDMPPLPTWWPKGDNARTAEVTLEPRTDQGRASGVQTPASDFTSSGAGALETKP